MFDFLDALFKSAYNNAKIRKYIIFHIFKDKIFSVYTYLTYLFQYCHLNYCFSRLLVSVL